jgi:hypothetical protein
MPEFFEHFAAPVNQSVNEVLFCGDDDVEVTDRCLVLISTLVIDPHDDFRQDRLYVRYMLCRQLPQASTLMI